MRSISIKLGPIDATAATSVSLSQTVPAGQAVVMDGAKTTGYSANSLATAASTTTAGATLLAAASWIVPASQIVLVSSGNDSAKTFIVSGLGPDGYTSYIETVTGSNASRTATKGFYTKVNSVVPSSTTAGTLSVGTNGYVSTIGTVFTNPTIITFTSGGVDTGITFLITGTDWYGNGISETITGSSGGVANSILSYKSISSIIASGATASTLTVGNVVANSRSPLVRLDDFGLAQTAIQCTVSGTINFTVQSTLDNPDSVGDTSIAESAMKWISSNDAAAVGASSSIQTNYAFIPKFISAIINSGTGSMTMTVTQAGTVPD